MSEARALDVFARHLDLAPLGGRRRGLVTCRFHAERTASLSVDLDRGIFHCFGCGAQGGVRRFAELVGEAAAYSPRQSSHYQSPLEEARAAILREAHRQPWARDDVAVLYTITRAIRQRRRVVDVARDAATRAGDRPESWAMLARAARLDVEADAIEAELEDTLR